MGKKVKCIECDNSMDWAIPNGELLKNANTQNLLKNTIVCGYTLKTKAVNHCQYCKHYEHKDCEVNRTKRRKIYENSLEQELKRSNRQHIR